MTLAACAWYIMCQWKRQASSTSRQHQPAGRSPAAGNWMLLDGTSPRRLRLCARVVYWCLSSPTNLNWSAAKPQQSMHIQTGICKAPLQTGASQHASMIYKLMPSGKVPSHSRLLHLATTLLRPYQHSHLG